MIQNNSLFLKLLNYPIIRDVKMIPKNATDNIPLFYEISELNRDYVMQICSEAGSSEYEFILAYSNTTKYAFQQLYYYLFKLFDLQEFQRIMVVFIIGLILILIFVK